MLFPLRPIDYFFLGILTGVTLLLAYLAWLTFIEK